MRASRLAQPDNMGVACYRTKKAPLLFITGSRIATLLCKAVKKVRPSTSADDLKKYSTHSLRVLACVLLDKAGMSPSFIQKHLCWLENLFKMYLRDTKAIQDKHLAALQSASSDVMALIHTPPDDIVCLKATMSDLNVPSDIIKDDQTWLGNPFEIPRNSVINPIPDLLIPEFSSELYFFDRKMCFRQF